jgi:hypothetical protein
MKQACRDAGHAFLASMPLLDRATMPSGIVASSIGSQLCAESRNVWSSSRFSASRIKDG